MPKRLSDSVIPGATVGFRVMVASGPVFVSAPPDYIGCSCRGPTIN